MAWRLKIGIALLFVSYLLLIPGITLPVLHMTTTLDKAVLADMGKTAILESKEIPPFLLEMAKGMLETIHVSGVDVIQNTQKSILGTAGTFWENSNFLVAILIVVFSIIIPVIKGSLMALAGLVSTEKNVCLRKVSAVLSKWSMTDVFVMALIIVFMGANTVTSPLIQTHAEFEQGFYYFLGYCLLSITASQLLLKTNKG